MSERAVYHEGVELGRVWYRRGFWAFRSLDGIFAGIAGSYETASGALIQDYADMERERKARHGDQSDHDSDPFRDRSLNPLYRPSHTLGGEHACTHRR